MLEDKKLINTTMQDIHLQNREKLNITGVKDVLSFDDKMIILETELGLLTVKGYNLRVNKLSIDTLEVSVDGLINTIIYSEGTDSKSVKKVNF